jgi:adenosylcobinamide kinase/adenosylcobinamide-phosphate guanylyltransferase
MTDASSIPDSQSNPPALTLVTGGARSGKSRYAEGLIDAAAGAHDGTKRTYVATAEAGDAEMASRIAEHQARRGAHWTTIEVPFDLCDGLRRANANGGPVLVDCLTIWLSNLMAAERDIEAETAALTTTLASLDCSVVLVSNEVGLGIVPDNALARRFRDHAGRLNQAVAAAADRVVFVAAGLPLILK